MKIYFVRHGEAKSNVDPHIPSHDDGLTELGKKQAYAVANRFAHIPIEIIISSPIQRALETAGCISEVTGKSVIENAVLKERRGAFEVSAQHKHLPTREYEQKMRELGYGQDWSIGKDEPFDVILERLKQTKLFLENRSEASVVVVSHTSFIKAFLAYLILGEILTTETVIPFIHTLEIKNAGMTVCSFNRESKKWRISTVNDIAHLGE